MDLHAFYMGEVFDAYEFFGAHTDPNGTVFRTYAPAAYRVTIIGEWNGWSEEDMQRSGQIYTYFSPSAHAGHMYKYVIYSASGRVEHCDPYGFAMELRPAFASIVTDLMSYRFTDHRWLRNRDNRRGKPMDIYEVHLGSWRKKDGGWYSYSEIADDLISYVKEHGFTHIEFMPLAEHPADESWGYQETGFYAPTARYGKPHELMQLVDKCHHAGIGVIMDFVPVHFAADGYALARYDGSPLYEYPSNDVGVSEWGSCNFIHSRRDVCCFLQSAANFWLTMYHFDGLRMDAISRAIYWQGDPARGINSSTVDFLRRMNTGLHTRHPSAMLIAEDSTSFPKITAPAEYGGLGFDYKWDMGWMNDTLDYMRSAPDKRDELRSKLMFSMHYFNNETYLLPLSHDENVHGKATVIQKMWGDREFKFPQVKTFYMYMYTHPGKKLLFMGSEFGQFREWDEKRQQDWELLDDPVHKELSEFMKKLAKTYISRPSLYAADYDPAAFEWIDLSSVSGSLFAYRRMAGGENTITVLNFSDSEQTVPFSDALNGERLRELLCTEKGHTLKKKCIVLRPFSGALFDESAF